MAGRTRRTRLLSLAGALLVHIGLLAGLVFSLKTAGPPPEPQAVVVSLAPLPITPRPQPTRRSALADAGPSAPRPPTVTAPSPIQAPQAATSEVGEQGPDLGKLRSLLRGSIGCGDAEVLKLTPAERETCRKWLTARLDPGREIPAPIDPVKRAWFDASLAARASPGRQASVGCALLIDGLKLKKAKAPPHALKLGPLPCIVVLPQGPLTEEVDLEAPSRNSARSVPTQPMPRQLLDLGHKPVPGG